MREFLFKERHGEQKNFSVMVDIIDENSENMTIMDFRGDENGSFLHFFPWNKGEVLTKTDLMAWFESVNGRYEGYEYNNNGEQYEVNLSEKEEQCKLIITPYIDDGQKKESKAGESENVQMIIMCYNSEGVLLDNFKETLENEVELEIPVVFGNMYDFKLVNAYWKDDKKPDAVKIDKESVSISLYIEQPTPPTPPTPSEYTYSIEEKFLPNVNQMEEEHSLIYAGDNILTASVNGKEKINYIIYDANEQTIEKSEFISNIDIDFSKFQIGKYRVQLLTPRNAEANYEVVKRENKYDK